MKKGWEIRKAGDLFEMTDFVSNGSFASLRENVEYLDHPDYAVLIRLADYSNGFDRSKFVYVSKQSYEYLAKSKLFGGEIIMSNVGSVGKSFLCPNLSSPMTLGPNAILIRSKNNTFFHYYFQTDEFQRKLLSISSKATLLKFNKTNFKTLDIPVPSLPEQQRIVDILDWEFAKIDALKANAEKSLQASKDLFISTLSKELKHRKGWKKTKIGDFCEIVRGKRFVRADIVKEGVPCIHYGDIYTYYGLCATKAKGCVSPELAKKLRFANKNDVVVVAAGENKMDIGVGVAWLGDEPAVVHDACFILRHSQNPMFLSFYFRSSEYHNYLKDEVNEGKICSFLTKPLAEARISLPPLQEQEQIVARLEIVYTNCKAMQENYKRTCTLCADLKQSILRKAFNGEL